LRYLLVLLLACSNAHSSELFVEYGTARVGLPGPPGIWRQPPLPYSFDRTTAVSGIGIRTGNVEVEFLDLGRVQVNGLYVSDNDFNPVSRVVTNYSNVYHEVNSMDTSGISFKYSPRYKFNGLEISPKIGLLHYESHVRIFDVPRWTVGYEERHQLTTPALGFGIYKDFNTIKVGLDYSGYKMVRSFAGSSGGQSSWKTFPGVSSLSLRVYVQVR